MNHLNEHRFKHIFQECMKALCSYSIEVEDTSHYLLHYHHHTLLCPNLTENGKSTFEDFEYLSDSNNVDVH